MEQILLTPEELEAERNKTYNRLNIEVDPLSELEDELEVLQDSNKAQLRKMIDWLHEDIRREITKDGEVVVFRKWGEDWQTLLKEAESEPYSMFLPCQYCGMLILRNKQRCPICGKVDPLGRGIVNKPIDEGK